MLETVPKLILKQPCVMKLMAIVSCWSVKESGPMKLDRLFMKSTETMVMTVSPVPVEKKTWVFGQVKNGKLTINQSKKFLELNLLISELQSETMLPHSLIWVTFQIKD